MATTKDIERLIDYLFGTYGHNKGDFYYYSCLGCHAVVQVMNEGGGVRQLLSRTTKAKLYEALDAIDDYVTYERYYKENK